MNVQGRYNLVDLEEGRGGESAVWFFLGTSAVVLITAAIAGAVGGAYFLKIPTSEGAAYGFFGTLLGLIFINSYDILWALVDYAPQPAQFAVGVVVALFLGITGVMFALGYLQLIRGSIQTMA